MSAFEVDQPILNSPFDEPAEHWRIEEGKAPKRLSARRQAGYFYRDPKAPAPEADSPARGEWQELELVNLIRERLTRWREAEYAGVTRTTEDLIRHWRREGRERHVQSQRHRRGLSGRGQDERRRPAHRRRRRPWRPR